MALVEMTVESQYLKGNTRVSLFLPDCPRDVEPEKFYSSGQKYRVLWLLHGTFGDCTDYVRKSMLEVYARERKLICVMPTGLNSDYTSWPGFAAGYDMWNYLTKELMPLVQHWFPASDKKEDNFITGLSMGGSGALKYILNNPDKFGAGCILSWAPLNYDAMKAPEETAIDSDNVRWRNQIANQGGFENFRDSKENSWRQILQMHQAGTLPKLFFTMGEEDFLHDRYVEFKEMCTENGIDIRFEMVPGLGHEWRFWDQALEKAMDFFGIEVDGNANAWKGLRSERNFFSKA